MKLTFLVITLCLFSANVFAKNSFLTKFKKAYPGAKDIATCALCHVNPDNEEDDSRNPYGVDLENNSMDFKSIEMMDSDGDGVSNIEEIKAGTLPGNSESHPKINQAPEGEISVSLASGPAPLWVDFKAINLKDDGSIKTVTWDFSDDEEGRVTGESARHLFLGLGNFTVTMTLTDDQGLSTVKSVVITTNDLLIEH